MKKISIGFLGFLSFWPFFYIVFFIISSFTDFGNKILNLSNTTLHPTIQTLFFITLAIIIIVMTFDIIFLFRTDKVKGSKRALWTVVLIQANIIALPIFWFIHFYKKQTKSNNSSKEIVIE